jgi:hypothetical protein
LPEFRHVFVEQRIDALTLFDTICDLMPVTVTAPG